jgi:hypothetical protein
MCPAEGSPPGSVLDRPVPGYKAVPMHPHNRRTRIWIVAVFVVVIVFTSIAVFADGADAHRASSRRGFEPSAATLACINRAEGSPAYDLAPSFPGDHAGRYQSNRAFEVAYAVNLIPPVHWWTLGSHTWDRADRWHPLIQDEMARNGLRARGLQPWPPASRRCPRR